MDTALGFGYLKVLPIAKRVTVVIARYQNGETK
jgi:hypothetical protein